MNLGALLSRASQIAGDRVAVFSGDAPVYTYRSLDARASAVAATLTGALQLKPRDRVILFATNCTDYIACLFGCWYAGLIVAPVNARLHARELAFVMHDTSASVCFASSELLETAASGARLGNLSTRIVELGSLEFCCGKWPTTAGLADTAADDVAWLFYTSGTTGRPKGAMLSHRNLLTMTLSYLADVNTVERGDSIIHAAPMSHGSGLYILPYVAGMAAQVVPVSGGFKPAEVWDLIQAHEQAALFVAPTMLDRLVTYKKDHVVSDANLKSIVTGGAPFYAEDAKRAISMLGPKVTQIYGQGESPMTISVLPASVYADVGHASYEARIRSVGHPHSVVDVRIAHEAGDSCIRSTVGEILVRGDTVMSGYLGNAEATASVLRDGWLRTGDLGLIDEEGFLTLKGRSKELIISGGSNIYPREVEDVLLLHPGVAEAAVVGRPHPQWGEEVVAFVVPKAGNAIDTPGLDSWCLQHIARFKRPKLYCIVDSLPHNAYGKVLKAALLELLKPQSEQGVKP